VIDVGANIGYITLNVARLVGPGGRVFAFEPSEHTYRHLCENVALNKAANVTCFQQALSDRTGEAPFIVATDDGLSRLDNRAGNTFGLVMEDRMKVKVDTLDNIWQSQIAGQNVKLLKMDIEGHEIFAMRGGARFLQAGCQYVISEINSGALRQNGVGLGDIVALMGGYGYSSYWIQSHTADWLRSTRMPTLCKVNDVDIKSDKSGDILFFNNRITNVFMEFCGDLICR
jgi:FkbM family methyltransferase